MQRKASEYRPGYLDEAAKQDSRAAHTPIGIAQANAM
jgi:hypothetical protein